ncbi:Fumarate hydratase class II (fragment) [Bradyrhizobium sp. ORS 278]
MEIRSVPAREPANSVMPGLVPGIHVDPSTPADVDGRDKPGHDDFGETTA